MVALDVTTDVVDVVDVVTTVDELVVVPVLVAVERVVGQEAPAARTKSPCFSCALRLLPLTTTLTHGFFALPVR